MSILTKRVTMTETAWEALERAIELEREVRINMQSDCMDISDAQTAFAEAELIGVTDTYATTRPNKDTWLEEMRKEGKEL